MTIRNYRTQLHSSLAEIGQHEWNALLAMQSHPTPFLSFAFLHALHATGCATAATGWEPCYLALWDDAQLAAVMPLYAKYHSYGEYVFDWAWADAYERNGLEYYPKLLSAVPFTPVSGNRLLAIDEAARSALIIAVQTLLQQSNSSSLHILFPSETEALALQQAGFLLRTGVQFHWRNQGYQDFEDFITTLEQKKRKNIRAERRRVREAGVTFEHISGNTALQADWEFFHQCYQRTYIEHRSTPYLNLDFFIMLGQTMPNNLRLIIASRNQQRIAAALLFHTEKTLYGRYWGALEHLPCLHFETAYYQPLDFCIAQGIQCFEGGAQGEHKMARGFLPHKTWSAHQLTHPAFSDAIERFLQRETNGMEAYVNELHERNPFLGI